MERHLRFLPSGARDVFKCCVLLQHRVLIDAKHIATNKFGGAGWVMWLTVHELEAAVYLDHSQCSMPRLICWTHRSDVAVVLRVERAGWWGSSWDRQMSLFVRASLSVLWQCLLASILQLTLCHLLYVVSIITNFKMWTSPHPVQYLPALVTAVLTASCHCWKLSSVSAIKAHFFVFCVTNMTDLPSEFFFNVNDTSKLILRLLFTLMSNSLLLLTTRKTQKNQKIF